MARLRIGLEDAYDMWDSEGATILDVVDTPLYPDTPDQIKGAIRIDPEDIPERFGELPQGKPVLVY